MSLLTTPSAARRPRWEPLRVADVTPLTDRAVAVTLEVPDALVDTYTFEPGQHLTLRRVVDGEDVRRSYSICLSRREFQRTHRLRVGCATVPGGVMSTWVNSQLRPGDEVEVMAPMGTFTVPVEADASRHHAFVAAGSGITPVLSLLTTFLEEEPDSRVTLLYGNRTTDSVMFLEELEDLKNAYPTRLHLVHVLSREPQSVELFSGRLDRERLGRITDDLVPVDSVDHWYLCGPFGMVEDARALLSERGVPDERVHHEVFHVDDPQAERTVVVADPGAEPEAVVTITLDGRSSRVPMPSREESILTATLRERPDAPYSCTGGVCGTCRARVVSGEVRMDRNYALEQDEVDAGVVLACQAHPVSDEVVLDYD